MHELLQLNGERGIELLDSAGQNHRAASGVFLNYFKTVCSGKLAYRSEIGCIGAVLLGEFLSA
jgi:hypothetical protein